METARGPIGTSGFTDVVCVLFRRDGMIADFTNNNWKSFSTVAGVDTLAAGEVGVTGVYQASIPAVFQKDWVEAYFFRATKASRALAFCVNPTITDATIATGTMLYRTAAARGGVTPTRDPVTGTKTFKDGNGVTVMTETPSNTAATRVFT